MISEDFLRLLRCPLNHGPLALAEEELIERLNERVAGGRLTNRAGEAVERTIDGGLIDQPATLLYPVHNEIPCLLVDEAIPLDQLDPRD